MLPSTQSKLPFYWDKINKELLNIYNMEIVDGNIKKLIQEFQKNQSDLSEGNLKNQNC